MQILVPEPTALRPFDGENIVVRPTPGTIEYLRGTQWADRLPRVVQARLADALQRAGGFGAVGKPGEGLAIDYQIVVEIRSFEVRLAGAAHAHVELFVRVLNDQTGVVRAAQLFQAASPLAGRTNNHYFQALDRAFAKAGADITEWTDSVI
jgi:cholesterol transport system auxiliary component